MKNLPIADILLYVYDMNDRQTILLGNNNNIYLGKDMTD